MSSRVGKIQAVLLLWLLGNVGYLGCSDWNVTAIDVAPDDADGDTSSDSGDTDSTESVMCPFTQEGFSLLNGGTTGGAGGETVTVTTQQDLEDYASRTEPYVIQVSGLISLSPNGREIPVSSNKTIIGVGADAEIVMGGFNLQNVQNIIIRNLTIGGSVDGTQSDHDGIQMDGCANVWIDHCTIHDCEDSLLDSRKDTTYLTISWTIFGPNNNAFAVGWTDNVTAVVTIHHNWIHDTGIYNPAVDNAEKAHLYNNYFQNISNEACSSQGGTNMVLQHSIFQNVSNPHQCDADATLVSIGNVYEATTGSQDTTGTGFDYFDPRNFYEYQLDLAEDIVERLENCAGPQADLHDE